MIEEDSHDESLDDFGINDIESITESEEDILVNRKQCQLNKLRNQNVISMES